MDERLLLRAHYVRQWISLSLPLLPHGLDSSLADFLSYSLGRTVDHPILLLPGWESLRSFRTLVNVLNPDIPIGSDSEIQSVRDNRVVRRSIEMPSEDSWPSLEPARDMELSGPRATHFRELFAQLVSDSVRRSRFIPPGDVLSRSSWPRDEVLSEQMQWITNWREQFPDHVPFEDLRVSETVQFNLNRSWPSRGFGWAHRYPDQWSDWIVQR